MNDQTNETEPAAAPAEKEAPQQRKAPAERLTLLQMLGSTFAAALGVQSSANRERDFSKGKASHFIILGIAFTALFVLAVVGVVNLVLP